MTSQFDKLVSGVLSPAVLELLSRCDVTSVTVQTGATAVTCPDSQCHGLTVHTYQYKPSLAEVRPVTCDL